MPQRVTFFKVSFWLKEKNYSGRCEGGEGTPRIIANRKNWLKI